MKYEPILYKCRKCKHVEFVKKDWKYHLKRIIYPIFLAFLIVTSTIGVLSIYNFVVVGVYDSTDRIFSLGGFGVTIMGLLPIQSEDVQVLKEISNNITNGCNDDYCKVEKVYERLVLFDYEIGKNSDVLKTWLQQSCDCDECSNLAIVLLGMQGINGRLVANNNHAWAIIYLNETRIKLDIVNGIMESV